MLLGGASGGIRTHKPFWRGVLSALCIPFHHTRLLLYILYNTTAMLSTKKLPA